ncbi:MAG: glycosyltransferase [Actinomycetota bacterium]|nr:glycosyltransferase [Actinomycetota bacterium]
MRIAYLGNFGPSHSTETHVAQALRALGHDLVCHQENDVAMWRELAAGRGVADRDLVLWTRTGWEWPSLGIGYHEIAALQRQMLARAFEMLIPTVGYHLDRWHGLARQHEIATEPFFGVRLLVTADGGHDAQWAAAGIDHLWMPPGVSEFECGGGTYRPEYASDVAFVGSWQGGYHREYPLRPALIQYLTETQSHRCRFWPEAGQEAVRGVPLRDLYASVKVLVGDSCLNGGITRYWSDRIPECLGRGGFLIHPDVEGLDEHFVSGEHLVTYPLGDFRRLGALIEHWTQPEQDEQRRAIALAGQARVLAGHTYTIRMKALEAVLNERGLLSPR